MIELLGVSKTYPGSWFRPGPPVQALDNVDLSIQSGTAVGIVGLNGAGKSTLVRLLLGYIRASFGNATIAGMSPRAYVEENGIAYLPERLTIPRHWGVREALRAYAMMGGIGDDAWERVESAMERLGLQSLATRRVGALSKGNLQRLGIAQAILGDRQVMVLDEPTDGLDPIWLAELRTIVAEWRQARADRIVILASHDLSEVEKLMDRVVLLHNGRVRHEFGDGEIEGTLEQRFLARVGELEEGRP
jgi:ABC-type multidrug transport system ATPase subunit